MNVKKVYNTYAFWRNPSKIVCAYHGQGHGHGKCVKATRKYASLVSTNLFLGLHVYVYAHVYVCMYVSTIHMVSEPKRNTWVRLISVHPFASAGR
jgi:hypothetical protein